MNRNLLGLVLFGALLFFFSIVQIARSQEGPSFFSAPPIDLRTDLHHHPLIHRSFRVARERVFPHRRLPCARRPPIVLADLRGLGLAPYYGCVIWFDGAELLKLEAPQVCTAVVHEYGHLTGLRHSDDPANVMYPYPTPANMPAACATQDPLPPLPTPRVKSSRRRR